MQTCSFCQVNISEDALYCESCGAQARCKNCRCNLAVGGRFCGACGTPVDEGTVEIPANSLAKQSTAINKIYLNKTGKNLTLDAQVSDDFGISLSQAIGSIVAGPIGLDTTPNRRSVVHSGITSNTPQLSLPETTQPAVDENEATIEGEVETDASPSSAETNSERGKLKEIFTYEGEKKDYLRLDETDLKASGQLDYSKRLTYLFLYAHKLEGRESVLRASLKEILEHDAVYDSNVINWINNSPDLRLENEQVRLRKPGRDNAIKYLQEVCDSTTTGVWMPDSKSRKQNKNANSINDSPESNAKSAPRKATGGSKVVSEWEAKWKSLNHDINGFELFDARLLPEKLMFGLWAIGKATDNVQQIVSGGRIADFLYQTFGIKIGKGGQIDKALNSKHSSGKVVKVKGGYRLLEAGVEYIEQTCKLSDSPKSDSASTKKVTKK